MFSPVTGSIGKYSLIIIAVLAAALWAARWYQARALASAVADLQARALRQPVQSKFPRSLEELPPPVRRYLNHVLPPDRILKFIRYEQAGFIRANPMSDRWMQFTASQVISPETTEFLWTAHASIAPLLRVEVADSLLGGIGGGRVLLLSAIPIASAAGNMEMNSGALHRFLAEAVWYPSALLPSPHLTWAPVDDHTAIATLADEVTAVSLEFRFNSQDEVTGIYTPGRWGTFDGGYRKVAWEGKFRRYFRQQGLLIPGEGEVGWHLNGEWRSVWQGTVMSASMEFQQELRGTKEKVVAMKY